MLAWKAWEFSHENHGILLRLHAPWFSRESMEFSPCFFHGFSMVFPCFQYQSNSQKSHIPNGIKRYREFCSLHGLKQLITSPTRVTGNSSSLLDHILTNSTDRVSQSGVVDTSLSDHQLIYCTRKISRIKFNAHKYIRIR